jgi:hypothetical protein
MIDPKVKRWRVSYKDSVFLDTGETCFRADVSAPMVLATEYDSVVQERDQLRKQVHAAATAFSCIRQRGNPYSQDVAHEMLESLSAYLGEG